MKMSSMFMRLGLVQRLAFAVLVVGLIWCAILSVVWQ